MNSQQIQFFFSAARHLNFTKVAEEFYTSQPTVSRQIAFLEEELGFQLFYRQGKQLRLTPGGLVMLGEFSKLQTAISEATARVGRIQQGLEGHLTIGYMTGLDTDYYVYPPSMTFTDTYPNITVDLDSCTFRFLRQRLYSGEYDLIFTYYFEVPFMHGILSQPVYTTGNSLIVSSRHPFSRKDSIQPRDFHGQTLIIPTAEDSEGRAGDISGLLARSFGCTETDLSRIHILPADSLDTKMFLVRAGRGIGITGNCMAYTHDDRYTLFPLPGETMEICAVWRQDNPNPAIPLYLDLLGNVSEIDVFNCWRN